MQTIGPKHPLETKLLRFSFAKDIAAPTTIVSVAAPTVSVIDGTDPTPASFLLGAPLVTTPEVLQRITGGLDGVTYLVECAATDSAGNVHVAQAVVPVRRKLY